MKNSEARAHAARIIALAEASPNPNLVALVLLTDVLSANLSYTGKPYPAAYLRILGSDIRKWIDR